MKRLRSYVMALGISAALHGAASSSLSISASTLRIVKLQVNAMYQDLPETVKSGLQVFREVVKGNQDYLRGAFEEVQQKFADEVRTGTCVRPMRGKILVYLATHALLLNNELFALKYVKKILELPRGSFLSEDKVGAYLLLEELVSRTSEPSEREALMRLLDDHEESVVGLSRACDQQTQDEFLYKLARKFWHESSYNPEQGLKAAWSISMLAGSPHVTGSLRCDVENMRALTAKFLPQTGAPISTTATSSSAAASSSSSSGQLLYSPVEEGGVSPLQENATLERINIKRAKRHESRQPGATIKRQRKKATNTPWYCAACHVFLASKASLDRHSISMSHNMNVARKAL